jgi:TonB family protein
MVTSSLPHPFVNVVVTYALNAAWQVPLVFAGAVLSARLLARLGPLAVHRMWVSALLLAAALPACRLTDWSLPLKQLWQAAAPGSGDVRVAILPGGTGMGSALQWTPWLLDLLFAAFAMSVLYGAARLGWALRRVQRRRRTATELHPEGELRQSWDALRAKLRGAAVQMAECDGVAGPMVLGVRHPLLLVPVGFLDRVAKEDRDAAFAHELAHVSRRDFAKNLVYSVLTLPVAWHPCVWLLRARVAESREMVCDAMAAEAIGGARAYARSLLRLASAVPLALSGRVLPAMGIFDGNTLERRVTKMMDKRKKLQGAPRWAAMGAVALLTVGAGASTMAMHLDVMAASAVAGQAPKSISVSPGVMEGNIISRPNPVYPPEAKRKHEQGTCTMGATISKQGSIVSLKVVKSAGSKDLDRSAFKVVSQWRYKPYLLNGDPIEVKTTINVTYTLDK